MRRFLPVSAGSVNRITQAVGAVLLNPHEVDLVRLTASDERATWKLFCGCPDHCRSFTDRAAFVLMRRLGLATATALDDDFSAERFVLGFVLTP